MQDAQPTRKLAVWLAAFFLVVVGAKLWTIQIFGTGIPYWDQWDEARLLFKPWLEGNLTWYDFFRAHNEHRIFFTRVLDLLELKLNGQWDPMLQMVVNVFIHVGYGCMLAFAIWRFTGRKHAGLICFLLMPFFALPFAGENTIHGFQSQMYFLNIFSLAAIAGLGFGKPCGGLWFCGLAAAVMAIFTMGSGFLAAAAVVGLMTLRMFKERKVTRGQILTLLCGLAVVALGGAIKVTVADHAQYQAKSVLEFLGTLMVNLAWPVSSRPVMALVFCIPLLITLVKYFQNSFKNPRAAEFILTFGLWGFLQAAALAYGRASLADSSRYLDTLSTLPLAALASLFVLVESLEFDRRAHKIAVMLAIGWAGILTGEVWHVSRSTMTGYLYWSRMWGLLETENVRAFVTTDNSGWLKSKEPLAVPYMHTDVLADLLRQTKILSIMPPDTRKPLKLEPDAGSDAAFMPDGFPSDRPKQDFTQAWGDYSTNRIATGSSFVSKPITANLPKLQLQLACGADTSGIKVQLVETSGRVTELPPQIAGRWQTLVVDAPKSPFRLEIKNQNPNSWVAVGNIKEYGRFSSLAQVLLNHAAIILVCGLCLFVFLAGFELSCRGLRLSDTGVIWLLVLLVGTMALAGAVKWRNFDSTQYSLALQKDWAAKFLSDRQPARAALHLREALWLQPDDAGAKKEMDLLKARGIEESLPEKLKP